MKGSIETPASYKTQRIRLLEKSTGSDRVLSHTMNWESQALFNNLFRRPSEAKCSSVLAVPVFVMGALPKTPQKKRVNMMVWKSLAVAVAKEKMAAMK